MTTDAYLRVCEEAWGEIHPRSALVHVSLVADRLFSGQAALANAVELRRFVAALSDRELPDDVVSLEGASLDVSTGLFR